MKGEASGVADADALMLRRVPTYGKSRGEERIALSTAIAKVTQAEAQGQGCPHAPPCSNLGGGNRYRVLHQAMLVLQALLSRYSKSELVKVPGEGWLALMPSCSTVVQHRGRMWVR